MSFLSCIVYLHYLLQVVAHLSIPLCPGHIPPGTFPPPAPTWNFFPRGLLPSFLLELTCMPILGWTYCSPDLVSSLLFSSSVSWENLQCLPNKKRVEGKRYESSRI